MNCQQQEEHRTRDTANQPNQEADSCEIRWSKILQLWSQSDGLVNELIAHTNGGTEGQPMYQLDGKEAERLISEYELMSSELHGCAKPTVENNQEEPGKNHHDDQNGNNIQPRGRENGRGIQGVEGMGKEA